MICCDGIFLLHPLRGHIIDTINVMIQILNTIAGIDGTFPGVDKHVARWFSVYAQELQSSWMYTVSVRTSGSIDLSARKWSALYDVASKSGSNITPMAIQRHPFTSPTERIDVCQDRAWYPRRVELGENADSFVLLFQNGLRTEVSSRRQPRMIHTLGTWVRWRVRGD